MASRRLGAVAPGTADRSRARAPVTMAAAALVPEPIAYPPPGARLVTASPGAATPREPMLAPRLARRSGRLSLPSAVTGRTHGCCVMAFEKRVPLLPAAATTRHRREAAKDSAERRSSEGRCSVPLVATLRLIRCARASTHMVIAAASRAGDVDIRPGAAALAVKTGKERNRH